MFMNLFRMAGDNAMSFIKWLGDFVRDSKTGKPSVKRFGLALAVTVICGIMFGMGMSVAMIAIESTQESKTEIVRIVCGTIENLSYAVLMAVTTGYLYDRTQERKMGQVNSAQQDQG